MFDSHCHLHDARFDGTAGPAIARAVAAGVRGFLLAGVSPEGWRDEEALVRAHPEVDLRMSVGIHPQLVAELEDPAQLDAMLAELDAALSSGGGGGGERVRPVAVGEIGLDGMPGRRASLPLQERAFVAQLERAREHRLPVILHVLRAHGRALEILRAFRGEQTLAGVVHSYSGSAELVREYLQLGLHVSFAAPVTYATARKVPHAVRAVPRERLLVETDAPFQTPFARRPQRNEPAFLVAILEAVAEIRGERVDEVAAYTAANADALLRSRT